MPAEPVDILIVDDDRDIADSLRDALLDEGYTLAVTHDGEDALSYLASSPPPSVILLDWMMPRCDGATFRQRQKALRGMADVPVVLLTADLRVDMKMRAIDSDAFLRKPISVDELLRVVTRYCGVRRAPPAAASRSPMVADAEQDDDEDDEGS